MITRKTPEQIALMRRAGRVVAEMHEECIRAAKPGATTLDVDAAGRDVLERRGVTVLRPSLGVDERPERPSVHGPRADS